MILRGYHFAILGLALLLCACAPPSGSAGPVVSVTRVDVVAALPTPTAPAASGDSNEALLLNYVGPTSFSGNERQVIMPYFLYAPLDPQARGPFPLIIVLHGAGRSADDALSMAPPALPNPIKERRQEFPAYVVYPLSPTATSWWQMPDALADFTATLLADHPIDPERVYLMGISNGGAGVYAVAAFHPEPFAAFVPIAGFWPYSGPNGYDPALLCGAADRGWYIAHGNGDEIIPWQTASDLHSLLGETCGAENLEWDLLPGLDHSASADHAFNDLDLLRWLFAQRRPG